MRLPTVTDQELLAVSLELSADEVGKEHWYARDSDMDVIAKLPRWLNREQAAEILKLILAHDRSGFEVGVKAGARDERDRIAYGFRVMLAPLTEVAESLQETLKERVSSR